MKGELGRAAAGFGVFLLLMGILVVNRQLFPAQEKTAAPAEYLGDEIIPPRKAPDFDLIDRSGERLKLADFKDKLVVLSFAFTNCATICPLAFQTFLGVERELGEDRQQDVALIFITLDPDLDTPERLEEATLYVGGHWHFLTEEQPILEEVWSAYRVFREKKQGVVDHIGLTYLIDGQGLIRIRYGGTPQSSVILNDIAKLTEED
jgi:protein SCO1/2